MTSATSSSTSNGGIRIGGLTSGFNTDKIIKQILAVDQDTIDKLKEKREVESEKMNTWNDVAIQLKSFAEIVTRLEAGSAAVISYIKFHFKMCCYTILHQTSVF